MLLFGLEKPTQQVGGFFFLHYMDYVLCHVGSPRTGQLYTQHSLPAITIAISTLVKEQTTEDACLAA